MVGQYMVLKAKKAVKRTIEEVLVGKVEIVSIDSVKLWANNPRKNDKAIPKVMESIKEYGQQTPIVVWEKNKVIYKGNTTLKAMKKLGYGRIAVAWARFKDEREAIAYGLADNKTGEIAEWDDRILAQLLQGETFRGVDLSEIGRLTSFTESDLKGIMMATQDMPGVLPDLGFDASGLDKADFLVIQFGTKERMTEFKSRIPTKSKHPRVISIDDMMAVLTWKAAMPAPIAASHTKIMLKKKG